GSDAAGIFLAIEFGEFSDAVEMLAVRSDREERRIRDLSLELRLRELARFEVQLRGIDAFAVAALGVGAEEDGHFGGGIGGLSNGGEGSEGQRGEEEDSSRHRGWRFQGCVVAEVL